MLKDWSALKKLLMLKAAIGGRGTITVAGKPPLSITGAVDLTKCLVRIDPYQAGSGDPSPDNVREISGWTGANVYRTGKNILDYTALTWTDGVLNDSGVQTSSSVSHYSSNIPISGGIKYTLKGTMRAGNTAYRVYFRDTKGNWISRSAGQNGSTFVFTTPENCGYLQVQLEKSLTLDDVQIEVGNTATEYAAYNGETYPVTWGDAGTVYGGTVNLISGVLTVTHGEIDSYDGETLPGAWISDRDVYSAGSSPTTGAQIVYELAEVQTYQLTPEEVSTVAGKNNIWADCGSYMECTYTR